MRSAWKTAVAGLTLTAACFAVPAHAQSENVKRINYGYYQNNLFDPNYARAVEAMDKIYKGGQYDLSVPGGPNPFIGLAEVKLNKDEIPEIIAFPVESDGDEFGALCPGQNFNCPFYILDVSDKKTRNLGIIMSNSIDLGDEIENGYWTLKAFKHENIDKKNDFEVYAYNPKTEKYEPKIAENGPEPK